MSDHSNSLIGIAGCGAMGLPMAQALQSSGFEVCGYDIRPTTDFAGFSASMTADPQNFSSQCDTIICVVRDERQVLDLCFYDQAIFRNTTRRQTFVLSSTVSPGFVHKLRKRLADNITLIDAPMSGAPLAATAATLTFMVGGPKSTVDNLHPLFSAMGNNIQHLGDLGSGMTAKVLNNFVAASTVVAVRNVLFQADQLGMDRQTLLNVLHHSSGQTWFGSNFEKIDWAGEVYDSANTIGILEKDVGCFIDALANGPDPFHKAVITALQTLPRLPA